jgi:hypothetical protein
MPISDRIGRLMPDLSQTILRFPIPVLISVALAIVANLDVAGVIDLQTFRWDRHTAGQYSAEQVYGALVSGFLAAGVAHLYAESRHWSRIAGAALAVVFATLFAVLCWQMGPLDLQLLFLLPGLVLAVMVAGYVHGEDNDNAVWMFNARLALAFIAAFIVALVFSGGLSAIVESLNYLFDADIDSDIHQHIWLTGATLIAPIFGLSMVSQSLPEGFHPDEQPGLLVTGSSLLLNYLLIPLALIYVVILHLYAGKMLVDWELPRGQVGIIVTIFAVGGAAVWLIASPWRRSGSKLLRFFDSTWFWFLIVPLVLLAIGTYRRISDYGVTPERYGLVALGAWVAFLVLWYILRSRTIQPRIILGSLAIILLASSFGPWGAGSVSVSSQYSRLITLMHAQGYFQDGRLEVPAKIDADASGEAHSMVMFLSRAGHLDKLAPVFSGQENDPFDSGAANPTADEILKILKFVRQPKYGRSDSNDVSVYFRSSFPMSVDVSAAEIVSGVHEIAGFGPGIDEPDTDPRIQITDDTVVVTHDNNRWEISTRDLLETVQNTPKDDNRYPPVVIKLPGAGGEARMVLLSVNGFIEGEKVVVNGGRAILILPAVTPNG